MPDNPKHWKDDLSLDAMFLRVINGLRTAVTQPYDEINKKTGTQWESSTRVQLSGAPTGVLYTILKTGSKPVDLKQRVIGFDGLGAVGRIYRGPTYTGGTPGGFWNMMVSKALVQPEVQLIVNPSVTDRASRSRRQSMLSGLLASNRAALFRRRMRQTEFLTSRTLNTYSLSSRSTLNHSMFPHALSCTKAA